MNNKGFTLIELLAVIVILAIIALIATPIIIGIIKEARKNAQERSAELVYAGVQYAYTSSLYGTANGAAEIDSEPTLDKIYDNFKAEHTKLPANKPESTATSFEITTDDKAYCTVTRVAATTGVDYDLKVKCGTASAGDDIFKETSVVTGVKASS